MRLRKQVGKFLIRLHILQSRDWASWWIQKAPWPLVEAPYELFVSILCMTSGIPLTLGLVSDTAVEVYLPSPIARLWGLTLTLGGFLVFVGLMIRNRRLERGGLTPVALASFVYSFILAKYLGGKAIVPAATTAFFGLACVSRLMLLTSADRIIQKVIEQSDE